MLYMYLMTNQKPLSPELVKGHVEHLKGLQKRGKLVLCGPFADFPGGMVIVAAENKAEAAEMAETDPFIASGCKTYELRSFEPANEGNHYLLP